MKILEVALTAWFGAVMVAGIIYLAAYLSAKTTNRRGRK